MYSCFSSWWIKPCVTEGRYYINEVTEHGCCINGFAEDGFCINVVIENGYWISEFAVDGHCMNTVTENGYCINDKWRIKSN